MSAGSILKFYAELNLVLAVAWAGFSGLRRLDSIAALRLRSRQLAVAGQVLLVLSLLAPCVIQLVPARALPQLHLTAYRDRPDDLARMARLRHLRRTRSPETPQDVPIISDRPSWSLSSLSPGAPWILALLALGALALFARMGRSLVSLRGLLRESLPLRKSGRLSLVVSEGITIPFSATTFTQAWVVLPAFMLARGRDFRIALRHELQHHRQRDALWAIALEALVCAFYLNPAAYLWRRDMTELEEFSCDEALTGRKKVSSHDYGSCLVRVAEAALGARDMPVGTACMASGSRNPKYAKSFLKRRIEMFMNPLTAPPKLRTGVAIGTLAALLTVAVSYGSEQALAPHAPRGPNPGQAEFDPAIQSIAQRTLNAAVAAQGAKSAFAIVSDPNTGRILAVVEAGPKATEPVLSHLIEPASLSKVLVVASALEDHVTTLDEMHDCEKKNYRYGDRIYHDWRAFDLLSTRDTVVFSSNICGIKVAQEVGAQGLGQSFSDFGFGPAGTAEDFPGARPGVIPPVDPRPGSPYVPQTIGSGYDFHVSPLELQQAFGAIANGGYLLEPQAATAPENSRLVIRRVISAENARALRETLEQVVLRGTGKGRVESALYTMAGKTATAYSPKQSEHQMLGGDTSMGTFIGFAPALNPRVEVFVGVFDPADGQPTGGRHAGPVFRQITEQVLQYLRVAPDKE